MFRYKVINKCFKRGRLYDPNVPGKDIFVSDTAEDSPHLELIEEVKTEDKKPTVRKRATAKKTAPPQPPSFQGKKDIQDVTFEA